MIIDPQVARREFISFHNDEDTLRIEQQIQQNGIDLRLANLEKLLGADIAIRPAEKELCNRWVCKGDHWILWPGNVYEVRFEESVVIPPGVAATIHPRSSFVRNGVFMWSGLYDAGFEGQIGCFLKVLGPSRIRIDKGDRMAQIVFQEANGSAIYAGEWKRR